MEQKRDLNITSRLLIALKALAVTLIQVTLLTVLILLRHDQSPNIIDHLHQDLILVIIDHIHCLHDLLGRNLTTTGRHHQDLNPIITDRCLSFPFQTSLTTIDLTLLTDLHNQIYLNNKEADTEAITTNHCHLNRRPQDLGLDTLIAILHLQATVKKKDIARLITTRNNQIPLFLI